MRFRLVSPAMDTTCTKIVWIDRFSKSPVASISQKVFIKSFAKVNSRTNPSTYPFYSNNKGRVDGFVRELTFENDFTNTFYEMRVGAVCNPLF